MSWLALLVERGWLAADAVRDDVAAVTLALHRALAATRAGCSASH